MPTEIDYAQLATWIDGEGSICIIASKGGKRKYHTLRVSVTNSDLRVMAWIRERFGGIVSCAKHSGVNHLPMFQWAASQTGIEDLLRAIAPYMVIKGEEVHIALEFRKTISHSNKGTSKGNGPVIPAKVIDRREMLRLELIATRNARSEARTIIQ